MSYEITSRNMAIGKYEVYATGKKLGGMHYVHVDYIHQAHSRVRHAYNRAMWNLDYGRNTLPKGSYVPWYDEWNVVKYNISLVGDRPDKISLLLYEDFFTAPHPVLLQSIVVDLEGDDADIWKKTDYRGGEIRYILHRKELLVDKRHPDYDTWAALTLSEEFAGLYSKEHRPKVGREDYWLHLLHEKGLEIVNGKLIKEG